MKQSFSTVSTGLSAKDRFAKMWDEVERARKDQMIHHNSARVKMGHEYLRQVRTQTS